MKPIVFKVSYHNEPGEAHFFVNGDEVSKLHSLKEDGTHKDECPYSFYTSKCITDERWLFTITSLRGEKPESVVPFVERRLGRKVELNPAYELATEDQDFLSSARSALIESAQIIDRLAKSTPEAERILREFYPVEL